MSNQDQWSREARTIALDHLKQGLKPQIIQQELVEDIPCLSISRSRYVNNHIKEQKHREFTILVWL